MSNQFCRFLGNQYRFDLAGTSPCCWYSTRINLSTKEEFHSLNEKLTAQDTWTDECAFCFNKEKKGLTSPRQGSMEKFNLKGLNATHEPDEITSLEIQTDADCNGACLICGVHSSSTWQKHEAKFNKYIRLENFKDKAQERLDFIKEVIDLSKLKKLGFSNGGEPLRTKTHLLFLRELEKIGNLGNVHVHYVTNGSVKPCEETVKLWRKAKTVDIYVSIDGIQEHFDYLRWPMVFSQVEDNLKFILDLDIPGVLGTSYAVTPFSAFYHDRYEEWAKQFFQYYKDNPKKMKIFDFFSNPFSATGTVNMSAIPSKLRFLILNKFGPTHSISKLTMPFERERYNVFMEYIKDQDQKRNLDFRTVFPEVQEYFI
jgi:hypothetical protein